MTSSTLSRYASSALRIQETVRSRVPTVLALALLAGGAAARGQEIEPRAYANAPVGLDFLVVGYTLLQGEVATDPSSPIQNAQLEVHGPIAGWAHTFGIAGKSAKVDLVVPYGFLSGSAEAGGVIHTRDVSGLWDPKLRLSVNFLGAPALAPAEYAGYRQDWIVGASFQLGMPLGQYDETRLANLGTNRWSLRSELGASKSIGRLVVEVAGGATVYTDNDEAFGGGTLEKDPLYSVQANAIYNFRSRIWLSVGGVYYEGGATTLRGVDRGDRLSSSRVGTTLSLPVGKRDSVKLFAQTGVTARVGGDFDAYGFAWQRRWGLPR
jgi:hypothetical protein